MDGCSFSKEIKLRFSGVAGNKKKLNVFSVIPFVVPKLTLAVLRQTSRTMIRGWSGKIRLRKR